MRHTSRFQRRLAAGAFLIMAAPVALGSVAYACQSLATLHANPGTAAAGGSLTLFGKNYSSSATSSPISIRLDTRDGQVIGTFAPTSVLSGTVTVPAGTAVGTHTLLATQTTASGDAASGTPGRTSVTVTAAGARSADVGPVAATTADPATVTPAAAAPAAATPAAAVASVATAKAPAAPAAASSAPAAAAPAAGTSAAVATPAAAATATPAIAAPDAGTAAPAAAATPVNVGLVPASSSSSSTLPGIALAAGLAMVLLALGAFVKSGRNILGSSPLAG